MALLFLYMAGFFTTKLAQQQHEEVNDIANLVTIKLATRNITNERQFVAIVNAQQKAILSSRITAKIAEVLVDVGDKVEQGDILIRLEGAALNAIVRQTEQALSSAQAQLNVARKEFLRAQQLLNKKLISQAQFDQVESQFKTQSANFKSAKASLEEAETTYGYSLITAPFSGVIDTRSIYVGDTAVPGMALLSLYNPQTLQLQANISESLINKAMLNKVLRYEIPTFAIKGEGQVVTVSPATDNSSHSFIVKIALNHLD
ncbi:efflux RND transporter periplasmic adaptor subunit [Psychromonas sp. MME2]|uniref:efflux RND transporter periplasmic adaptor subunit n=1 Tax=Psychromonas sp. MME2 TaxID=3231033 RepID=UPI00339BC956